MKKTISFFCILLATSSFAKSNSYQQESNDVFFNGTCIVQIDDAYTTRFVNVNYIRTIEISNQNKDKKANEQVLNINMASNYSAQSSYSIAYPNKETAMEALQDLLKKIKFCGK